MNFFEPLRKLSSILTLCSLILLGACAGTVHSETADSTPTASPPQSSSRANNHSSSISTGRLLDVKTPPQTPAQIKNYAGFRLSFNADNHTPNWVAWELLAEETEGLVSRKSSKFWQDSDVDGCPSTADYTHSGFDRGHMCPAADNKLNDQMMTDCFVMANICPQDHKLNSGAWSTLEKKCRTWANNDGEIIIIAGPIYKKSDNLRIGDTGVRVPSSFFKVILSPSQQQAIGFIYPNMTAPGDMFRYAVTVDQVESQTGLDFFSSLPDDIENKVEANFHEKHWRY